MLEDWEQWNDKLALPEHTKNIPDAQALTVVVEDGSAWVLHLAMGNLRYLLKKK